MKRYLIITVMFGVAALTGFTQGKNIPQEKSTVNKEYDENGNLIKYDSTYVWSWSGDSAFQFEFPEDGFFSGKDFPGFDEMFSDSVFSNHFNHPFFNLSPFNHDEFFRQFEQQFPDSAFSQHFEFHGDSAFVFPFDFGSGFGNSFSMKAIEEMQKEMQQLFENQQQLQGFQNDKQRKAWEELMKKQQKEQQELLKKWKEN